MRKKCKITLFVMLGLFLCAGSSGADDSFWPYQTDLVCQGVDVGDVTFWNTKNELKIYIIPATGSKIKEASVFLSQEPDGYLDILDKKGKPDINMFPYKIDYLKDYGNPADVHLEIINTADENFCWSPNPDAPGCPPPIRYLIVQVELMQWNEVIGVYEEIGEPAFAFGGVPIIDINDKVCGYNMDYTFAKITAGHFIDANVNGLAYETITQSGTTGEEGQFWFIPMERISFSVGNLPLGDALANHRVSPVDLFEGSDMDDNRVINMAWLLQNLDADGMPGPGAINISEEVVDCLNSALGETIPDPDVFFSDADAVGALITATQSNCASIGLTPITRLEAWENLVDGQKAGNLMKKNVSKTPGMKSDKGKIEIMPVYVPAKRADESDTVVSYYDADGILLEQRNVAKPIVVSYLDEVEGTGASDVFVAISRDDGETWKRRNISKTADKSSRDSYPGESKKPMLKVKDNMIFVAWTDKYCHGGRPGYAINLCDDPATEAVETPETGCAEYCTGNPDEDSEVCTADYPGDDAYWQDDLYGVSGPQRAVYYEDYPEMGEVPFSCVWTARGIVEPDGEIVWFKPERLTSGRRDAYQLFAGAGEDVAFAIVWQEDPKGLMPGEGEGPGDGWSGANTHNKADIWFSYITLSDFALIDYDYPAGGFGENDDDIVNTDPELAGRVKALVPMSLPVRISDNDVCSAENMDPDGGNGEHDFDEEGQGTHRYCGTLADIGTVEAPGTNPLCAYTVEKINPKGDVHHVCVTADGRFLDGNTGASRPNVFLQPYKKPDNTKSAWVIIGYEESKGVGIPPVSEHEHVEDHEPMDGLIIISSGEEDGEDKYKPDQGKNVIYHSFDLFNQETVAGGGILNLPEEDEEGNPVYVLNEDDSLFEDWKGDPVLAYENARRVRFLPQPKSKAGLSGTVLVALYRQGEEGHGKPADVFMRRASVLKPDGSFKGGNPYTFENFVPGAQNVSSVSADSDYLFQDPFDPEKPEKMLRWTWTPTNLADASGTNPRDNSMAHRGALIGDDLIIGYIWTPNWGRNANDKYDLYVRRSFDGGQSWTTNPFDLEPIEHNVVFRVPILDYETQTVTWDEEVVTTTYEPGDLEPPRNVSNLRNNRVSVLEPRLVKTPGTIVPSLYQEDSQDTDVLQVAYGLEFNQNQEPNDAVFPKMPLDIYYSRTLDKGQHYDTVIVTPQDGGGKPQEGWSPLANDKPQQGAAQIRQTPDGSRMYSVWLEEGDGDSDIMFRRVDYR